MPHILVLGASGQLGSELIRQLTEEQAIGLTRSETDVTDPSALVQALARFRPQTVFNCAAYVKVDDAEEEPETAFRINSLAPLILARLCADRQITLVHISTDYVFDGRKGGPYTELDPPQPLNVYGTTKLMGEIFVRGYCPNHFVVRTAGLYGLSGSRAKGGSFLDRIFQQVQQKMTPKVVSDQITSPTFTADLAKALIGLSLTPYFGLYHIVNTGYCSWHQFAVAALRLAGIQAEVEAITSKEMQRKAKRPSFSALTSVRLLSAGVAPLRSWEEALKDFVSRKGWLVAQNG